MQVELAYGRNGLTVDVPEGADVLAPAFAAGLPDESQALRHVLRHPIASPPLAALVKPGDSVVVQHTDITRATPNSRLLPVLLAELKAAGVSRQDITLLNALGTHRRQTEAELRAMLGDAVVDGYRCLQHDAWDDANLVSLGQTALGHPVRVNRTWLEADVRILTGFIEPHFFAGYSGGPKGVLPAMAGAESVLTNHGVPMIAHREATWGVTEGNPIWEEMREIALRTNPTFLVNVTLNARREITGVFAGDMLAAHAAGCASVRRTAMVPVERPYDIVITTNSGYPLDQNLYQSVKGMSAAAQIVEPGGFILAAARCNDGFPAHGNFRRLMVEHSGPQAILDTILSPDFSLYDQWEAQVLAMIQLKARVGLFSELPDDEVRAAHLEPVGDIEARLSEELERRGDVPVAVLPEGPMTIPYLAQPHAV